MDPQLKDKNTDDLKQELMKTDNLDVFLEENEASFCEESVKDLLRALFERSSCTKADLARRCGVSEVYLYQLLSGTRSPSRDCLLSLAIGMNVSLDEMQDLLHRCGHAELYARDKRDAVIIYGISHGMTPHEVNDLLFDKQLPTLL